MVALPFCHLTLTAAKPKNSAYRASLTTLGDHIRARRLDLGLMQDQVGRTVGVTACTIQYWESNRVKPAVHFVPRIIKFLGYDPTGLDEPESLGERIRLQRRRLGLTLKELARRLETDPSNLAGWETGRHKPAKRSLALIGEFLAKPPEWIDTLGTAGLPQPDPDIFSWSVGKFSCLFGSSTSGDL